ncbi:hypothetical protein RUND412_008962 [Rhizina undulata]
MANTSSPIPPVEDEIIPLPDYSLLSVQCLSEDSLESDNRLQYQYWFNFQHRLEPAGLINSSWKVLLLSGAGPTATLVDTIYFDPMSAGFNAVFAVWATLNWYFQLPEPELRLDVTRSGAPRADWKVGINTQHLLLGHLVGVFYSTEHMKDSERAGLITAGSSTAKDEDWKDVYALRSSFWQIPYDSVIGKGSIPKPVEYRLTANGVRHPVRPKPREWLYRRFIKKFHSFISFRLAREDDEEVKRVNRWMNNPRVAEFWGEEGDLAKTRAFLEKGRASSHCFPVIGVWEQVDENGVKISEEEFGYFEIYWVKEDNLGRYTDADMWDRGVHCLVGEEKFRGSHRVKVWISSLVHFMLLDDPRTQTVMLEPRVDNAKFIDYLTKAGFYKEKEFAFPHKQAALMKLRREAWDGPAF